LKRVRIGEEAHEYGAAAALSKVFNLNIQIRRDNVSRQTVDVAKRFLKDSWNLRFALSRTM